MSASEIMQGFMTHRKKPTDNASDFGFQLRTCFIEKLPTIKQVNVLVKKIDDFETALRKRKTLNYKRHKIE